MTFIKRATRVLLTLGLVAAMAAPVTADAAERPETKCGGRWDAGGVCSFRYAGGGISVGGNFRSEGLGYITVTLEAVDPETKERTPLLSCGTPGNGFGGCVAVSTDTDPFEVARGDKLVCTVSGMERGRYKCTSDE